MAARRTRVEMARLGQSAWARCTISAGAHRRALSRYRTRTQRHTYGVSAQRESRFGFMDALDSVSTLAALRRRRVWQRDVYANGGWCALRDLDYSIRLDCAANESGCRDG